MTEIATVEAIFAGVFSAVFLSILFGMWFFTSDTGEQIRKLYKAKSKTYVVKTQCNACNGKGIARLKKGNYLPAATITCSICGVLGHAKKESGAYYSEVPTVYLTPIIGDDEL